MYEYRVVNAHDYMIRPDDKRAQTECTTLPRTVGVWSMSQHPPWATATVGCCAFSNAKLAEPS
jgi:hypothetical protein